MVIINLRYLFPLLLELLIEWVLLQSDVRTTVSKLFVLQCITIPSL